MTRPYEIAALADELVGIQKELAIEEWRDALGKAAHHLRRLSATSPGDAVRDMVERWQKDEAALEAAFGRVGVDEFGDGPEVLRNLGTAIHFAKGLIGKAALAPAENAGNEFTRSFDTRGTTMRRRCNIIEITCETGEIANRVADQLRSPSATPTPPSAGACGTEGGVA